MQSNQISASQTVFATAILQDGRGAYRDYSDLPSEQGHIKCTLQCVCSYQLYLIICSNVPGLQAQAFRCLAGTAGVVPVLCAVLSENLINQPNRRQAVGGHAYLHNHK